MFQTTNRQLNSIIPYIHSPCFTSVYWANGHMMSHAQEGHELNPHSSMHPLLGGQVTQKNCQDNLSNIYEQLIKMGI